MSALSFFAIFFGVPYNKYCGAVAQLVERMDGIHEVTGSIPVSSTSLRSRWELRLAGHLF